MIGNLSNSPLVLNDLGNVNLIIHKSKNSIWQVYKSFWINYIRGRKIGAVFNEHPYTQQKLNKCIQYKHILYQNLPIYILYE